MKFPARCLLLYLVFCIQAASARTAIAPVVGLSYANTKLPASMGGLPTDVLPSIKAGIHIEQKMSNTFYFQPGIFYSVYGFKLKGSSNFFRYNTAEVPLYLLIKTGMPCRPRMVLGLGVFAAKVVGSSQSDKDVNFSMPSGLGGGSDVRVGGGFSLGYELPMGTFIAIQYQALFNGKNTDNSVSPQLRLYQYGISVGYLVNKVSRRR